VPVPVPVPVPVVALLSHVLDSSIYTFIIYTFKVPVPVQVPLVTDCVADSTDSSVVYTLPVLSIYIIHLKNILSRDRWCQPHQRCTGSLCTATGVLLLVFSLLLLLCQCPEPVPKGFGGFRVERLAPAAPLRVYRALRFVVCDW